MCCILPRWNMQSPGSAQTRFCGHRVRTQALVLHAGPSCCLLGLLSLPHPQPPPHAMQWNTVHGRNPWAVHKVGAGWGRGGGISTHTPPPHPKVPSSPWIRHAGGCTHTHKAGRNQPGQLIAYPNISNLHLKNQALKDGKMLVISGHMCLFLPRVSPPPKKKASQMAGKKGSNAEHIFLICSPSSPLSLPPAPHLCKQNSLTRSWQRNINF